MRENGGPSGERGGVASGQRHVGRRGSRRDRNGKAPVWHDGNWRVLSRRRGRNRSYRNRRRARSGIGQDDVEPVPGSGGGAISSTTGSRCRRAVRARWSIRDGSSGATPGGRPRPAAAREPDATIASVALRVDYWSPFALSAAFTRVRGFAGARGGSVPAAGGGGGGSRGVPAVGS